MDKKKFLIIYFLLRGGRESECMHCIHTCGGGAKGEGEQESQAGCMPSAEAYVGLSPLTLRS